MCIKDIKIRSLAEAGAGRRGNQFEEENLLDCQEKKLEECSQQLSLLLLNSAQDFTGTDLPQLDKALPSLILSTRDNKKDLIKILYNIVLFRIIS